MNNLAYLLICFIIFFVFLQLSFCDRKCGYKKFFNKQINDCSECHSSCKECNGTYDGNCLECFNSKNHKLCSWGMGYYCLDECSKVPKYHSSITELTTPSNDLYINFNIIHALLLLLLIVTIPFICIIFILIIIFKYNRPQRAEVLKHSDVESKATNMEKKSMLSKNMNSNEKSGCKSLDRKTSHKECCTSKSAAESKTSKPLTIELPDTPKESQKQSVPPQPPNENMEKPEHISKNTRMALNNLQDNLAIASKISIVPESFNTEQLDWDRKELICSGAFGNVYKCVYTDGNKCYHVAVKQPKRATTNEPFKEERIMAKLKDHPHIIKLITTRLDENMLLVMPLMKSCLSKYLHSQRNLTLTNKIRFCQQIANGMSYLMFRQIIHCDLKASNVLVVDENLVQISDFGKSERLGDINISRRPITGTITHTAMEILEHCPGMLNCEATDVWSFGVTIWEIFNTSQRIPYADCVTPLTEIMILNYLHEKNYLKTTYWPKENAEALVAVESYMKKCLLHAQGSRPTFDKLWYWLSTLLPEGQKLIPNTESTSTRSSKLIY